MKNILLSLIIIIVASCNSGATTYTWKYQEDGAFFGQLDTLSEPSADWFFVSDYFYPIGYNTAPTASFYGLDSAGSAGFYSVSDYATAPSVGGSDCINVQTLSGNLTLTNDSCKYQHLDPNGANRTITLPTSGVDAGKVFVIRNTAAYNTLFNLLVSTGTVIDRITSDIEKVYYYDGSGWVLQYDLNISIGNDAYNNYDIGIGIGYNAYSNYEKGIGIGREAQRNYTYGVGVGDNVDRNYSYGVGIGYKSENNYNYGTGVGALSSCNGNPYAVALGAKRIAKRRGEVSLLTDESTASKHNYYIAHYVGETTDDSGDIIFLNAADYCDISANSAVMFKINAICKDATETNMAIWSDWTVGMTGIIYRAGTAAPAISPVAAAINPFIVVGFGSNPTITVGAGAANNDLVVTITGVAGTNLDWNVIVELIEITD